MRFNLIAELDVLEVRQMVPAPFVSLSATLHVAFTIAKEDVDRLALFIASFIALFTE